MVAQTYNLSTLGARDKSITRSRAARATYLARFCLKVQKRKKADDVVKYKGPGSIPSTRGEKVSNRTMKKKKNQ